MNCAICGTRKPKRYCPGIDGAICSVCCGTEREQSVDCPIACDYLKEAHRHEKPPLLDPATLPNQDVRVPESFLQQHEWLLVLTGSAIVDGALRGTGTTDYDIRAALESLIGKYRGGASGVVIAENPFAANIEEAVQTRIAEIRRRIADSSPETENFALDDSTILAIFVFLQRLEYANNNGRKRSRAFFDFLMQFHVPSPLSGESGTEESLEPEAPLVIS